MHRCRPIIGGSRALVRAENFLNKPGSIRRATPEILARCLQTCSLHFARCAVWVTSHVGLMDTDLAARVQMGPLVDSARQ
jgi:hypothetical protein